MSSGHTSRGGLLAGLLALVVFASAAVALTARGRNDGARTPTPANVLAQAPQADATAPPAQADATAPQADDTADATAPQADDTADATAPQIVATAPQGDAMASDAPAPTRRRPDAIAAEPTDGARSARLARDERVRQAIDVVRRDGGPGRRGAAARGDRRR